jgi:hypothetical protein
VKEQSKILYANRIQKEAEVPIILSDDINQAQLTKKGKALHDKEVNSAKRK